MTFPIELFNKLKLSGDEVKIFLISFIVTLVAKGAALFPLSYSTDDMYVILKQVPLDGIISNGRFGMAILVKLTNGLGAATPHTNVFFMVIYMISLVWVGIIVCRIWKLSEDMVLSIIVVLFIAIHPYQAEEFTFKSFPFYIAISIVTAFVGLYFSDSKLTTIIWTSLCVVFSISVYQVSLNYVFIATCFAFVIDISRRLNSNVPFDLRQTMRDQKIWPRSLTICLAVFLYLLIARAAQYVARISPSGRFQIIGIDDIWPRLAQLGDSLIQIFILPEPILPVKLFKIMLIFLGSLAVLLMSWRMLSQGRGKYRVITLGLMIFLLFASILGVIGPALLSGAWWPVPRAFSAISLFSAGIVVLAFVNSGRIMRLAIVALSCIMLFGFVGINNRILTDQLRVNMRDFHKANRIIARLESLPTFSGVRRVAVIGDTGFPSGISTAYMDMNISAFNRPWSKVKLINELSGYDFADAAKDEQKSAEEYCNKSLKWPHQDSVTIEGALGIVCL